MDHQDRTSRVSPPSGPPGTVHPGSGYGSGTAVPDPRVEGTLLGGRYRVQECIGAGAMGVVWTAWDRRLARTVAVKQLIPPRGEDGTDDTALRVARARAMREGRIAARVVHPRAIAVFDVVTHAPPAQPEMPWLVMEYLPSRSLAAVLAERGPLAAGRGGPDRRADRRRALRGARGRHRPRRRQARQRAAHRGRRREAHRLRGLAGLVGQLGDRRRPGGGHPRLLRPRGRPRRGPHARVRRVLPRRHALRGRRERAGLRPAGQHPGRAPRDGRGAAAARDARRRPGPPALGDAAPRPGAPPGHRPAPQRSRGARRAGHDDGGADRPGGARPGHRPRHPDDDPGRGRRAGRLDRHPGRGRRPADGPLGRDGHPGPRGAARPREPRR